MSRLSKQDLHRALKQGDIKPLYLLFGEETYLRDLAARTIANASLEHTGLREFNEDRISLAKTDLGHAIAAAEQLPMMSIRRVVEVRDFSKLGEADAEGLMRFLTRPVESSVVIFVADDLDKRRKLTKTLIDTCATIEFTRLTDVELVEWAKKRLNELKVETDQRTLGQIVAYVGNDVRTLSNELDKLAVAAIGTGLITMELVDALVGRSRELSNFELTEHLVSRNRKRALQTLRRLLDDGAEPVMLIGLIASNYHRLALAAELMERGATNQEVYRQVGIFGRREEFLATARRSDSRGLLRSIERIAAADLAIKTSRGGGGPQGSRLQLEFLVSELAA
ncbi:MAG: polymerase subunit delta [Acidobacteriota bacterium]|jgi:DNA polymerase-3 subunit delta|nr:polymerase subunit delta [Acidobacteriota bacterium]